MSADRAARARLPRLLRVAAISLLASATACEWFTDFKRQPHVVTWESLRTDSLVVRGSPQFSVPTTGTAMAGYQVSYTANFPQIDSLAAIPNPTPINAASLANGRKHYQINCAVCHGDRGDGTGSVVKFGLPAPSLLLDATKNRTDGYLFGMIRNGRGLMPTYNRIEEPDRWDVVNYVRALQGRTSGVPFETGPLAPPGVTGDKLPGPSQLGPTRAVPLAVPAALRDSAPDTARRPPAGRGGR
jgi:mono/diheme cytochrome c family protein